MPAWKKGQSGNPAGRKPGAEVIRQLLEPKREKLVQKAVTMALAGDVTALRICIDRLAPPPRAEAPKVTIEGLSEATTLTDKANVIMDAVGRGDLAPDIGAMLVQALTNVGKVVEIDELDRRVRALEAGGLV